jgi:hypothetical protein
VGAGTTDKPLESSWIASVVGMLVILGHWFRNLEQLTNPLAAGGTLLQMNKSWTLVFTAL